MLISKFDLYKNEWLDLVFSNRNTAYGAYELRQHHSRVMAKALGAMIVSISVVAFVFGVILRPAIHAKPTPPDIDKIIPVTVVAPPPVTPPAKKPPVPDLPKPPAQAQQQVASTRFTQLVVTDDQHAEEPPTVTQLQSTVISTTTVAGPAGPAPIDKTPGTTTTPAVDPNVIVPAGIGLEREPEPKGGFAAFNKFLQNHLHFPQEAQENHVGGKVFLSFVVEKDGSLSNITLLRGPGFGTNEEAMRVLKIAPAWNPGIQNDKPVRVQYNIPINFQLNDDDQ